MLKYEEIKDASVDFDAIRAKQWKVWVKSVQRFRDDSVFFSDLDSKLSKLPVPITDDAEKELERQISIRCLNVLSPKIEELDRQINISGGEDAVRYSMNTEREWLIGEGIEAIYSIDEYILADAISAEYAIIDVGQRDFPIEW